MFFSLETILDSSQLTIVTHPFLLQSLDHLLVGLLDGLSLVVLNHDLIQSVLKNSDGPHHGIFLDISKFVILNFLEFILKSEKHIFLYFGLMFLLIQQNSKMVLISRSRSKFAASSGWVIGSSWEYISAFFGCDELVPYRFQFLILTLQLINFLSIFLFYFLGLEQKETSILLQHFVFLVLVFHLVVYRTCLAYHCWFGSHPFRKYCLILYLLFYNCLPFLQ